MCVLFFELCLFLFFLFLVWSVRFGYRSTRITMWPTVRTCGGLVGVGRGGLSDADKSSKYIFFCIFDFIVVLLSTLFSLNGLEPTIEPTQLKCCVIKMPTSPLAVNPPKCINLTPKTDLWFSLIVFLSGVPPLYIGFLNLINPIIKKKKIASYPDIPRPLTLPMTSI